MITLAHVQTGHKVISAQCYHTLDMFVLEEMLTDDDVWYTVLSFDNIDDTGECFATVLQGLLDALLPLHKITHVNP